MPPPRSCARCSAPAAIVATSTDGPRGRFFRANRRRIEEPIGMTERSRNEVIKEDSRFLRGTIAEGLRDHVTGAIAEDDTQLTKFHGIYLQDDRDLRGERAKKKMEKAFSFMARVRIPAGVLT